MDDVPRGLVALVVASVLVFASFPAWAQIRFAPETAPLDAPAVLEAVPAETSLSPLPLDASFAAAPGESLSALPLEPLSAGSPRLSARLQRAPTAAPLRAVRASERGRAPLTSRILEHAARQGFALQAPRAIELDDLPSLEQPVRPAAPLPGLRAAPEPPKESGSQPERRAASSPAWQFLASMAFVDVGVEALSVAVPQLAEKLSGHFLSASSVSTVAFAALTVGTLLAGPIVDRLGWRKVYAGLQVGRAAGAGVLAVLYWKGALGLPALTFLFGFDFLLQGVSRVAEGVLPTLLYGSKPLEVNRFGTRFQMMIESAGIAIPAAAGFLISAQGFGAVLAAYPFLMLASAAVTALKLRLPEKAAPSAPAGAALWSKSNVKEVFGTLRKNPGLRRAAIAYGLTLALTNFIYFSIAPAYGLYAAHDHQAAASTAANLISFYGLGGFAGTGVLAALDALARRKMKLFWEGDQRRAFLKGTLNWLWVGAAAALGFWAFAFAPAVGAWLGYAAMLPLGVSMAGVFVQLETLIKSDAPEAVRGSVLSFIRAGALLFATVGFVALGALFEVFSTSAPVRQPTSAAFFALALALSPISLVFLWVARGLGREAKEKK
jgi:MFS family permease